MYLITVWQPYPLTSVTIMIIIVVRIVPATYNCSVSQGEKPVSHNNLRFNTVPTVNSRHAWPCVTPLWQFPHNFLLHSLFCSSTAWPQSNHNNHNNHNTPVKNIFEMNFQFVTVYDLWSAVIVWTNNAQNQIFLVNSLWHNMKQKYT